MKLCTNGRKFTYCMSCASGKAGVCYQVTEYTYRFDGGKTYEYTEKFESHNTYDNARNSEDSATGISTTEWTCHLCDQVVEIAKWDSYGRQIYEERLLENYRRERVYNGCDYVETYYYANGDTYTYTGTNHLWVSGGGNRDNCTQYFYEGRKCLVCNQMDGEWIAPDRWYYENHGHNWYYDDNSQIYTCYACGTQSTTGANGLISIEDMATENTLAAGYFNYREFDMDSEVEIEIIVNYQADGSGIALTGDLFTKTITRPEDGYNGDGYYYEYREAGIVTVNLAAVRAAIAALDGVEAETISIVFWVLDESQTQYDEETGEPKYFYLAHAITFDWADYAA